MKNIFENQEGAFLLHLVAESSVETLNACWGVDPTSKLGARLDEAGSKHIEWCRYFSIDDRDG